MNVRLLQLASPGLPVGAYSYSQGLEAAVEAGWIKDAASASCWIGDVLALNMQSMEAPVFLRLAAAWSNGDLAAVRRWNEEYVASRETAELRAETLQMGYSLRNLLRDLDVATSRAGMQPGRETLFDIEELAYPAAFTFATAAWDIDAGEALAAYLFSWIENQVLAALKSVPLGQTEGQRILLDLAGRIGAVVEAASMALDQDFCNFAPGLAILSARHETQYSRIFRS